MTVTGSGNMNWIKTFSMIQEIKKEISRLQITPKVLRNFGLLFYVIFGIWSALMYWRIDPHWSWTALVSIGFLLVSIFFPMVLRQPYRLWMSLAFVMGWFMTRLILTTLFFVAMTPMGVVLRLLNKDLLSETIHKNANTYWNRYKGTQDKERYEKQF